MNKKLLAKIRANANKARQIDFAKMRQYAVERHEDTLNILIGLSLEIEKLHDIWFPHNIIWHSVDSNSLHNPFTGVKLSYRQQDKKIAWVWFPGKIQFLFNMNTNKCLFVSYRKNLEQDGGSYDQYKWKGFNFLECAKNDNYNDGIESFVKTPSWETYFPDIHLQLLGDYQGFLNKIDEDYENAVRCRELFNQTIELIAKNEEEYLKLAAELTSRGESHGRVQEG